MNGGVESRRGKVDEVPERAAAEAEAPALELELPAIGFPRDDEASALTLPLNLPELSYAGLALLRHGVCPQDRMYSIAFSVFLGNSIF